ncbi:EutN/CcmL family microcompartment protein [Salinibacterium sp. TMP30]|uniref:EutN/CcmL family microcompartment protein n=1 Tax=Salinibacterium sp. TMP30 TaxID=3138237 RepID=UPI003138EF76
MLIGQVINPVVCDAAIPELRGLPLVTVAIETVDASPRLMVAVDVVGAGVGANVLIAEGDAARLAVRNLSAPIEAAVVGLVRGSTNVQS